MKLSQIDRYRGSLLGLAVGDALGAPFEGFPPGDGTSLLCEEMVGGGPFNLAPGEWTDDTSMALCLAESLIERQGFDPLDQLERYVRWMREGHLSSNGRCFDIGGTVHAALVRFLETRAPFCGSTDPLTAGNGSIMRLAPVAIFYSNNPKEAIERCGESSRTTHAAETAVDACRYFGGLIVGAVQGASREELLGNAFCPIQGYWHENPLATEVYEIACGSFRRLNPPDIHGSGYVVKSLEAALWAFCRTNSFREGCLTAVSLGCDADTTGAIYGQLAGAFYGEGAIPESWLRTLAHRQLIEHYAEQILNSGSS